MSRLTRDQEIKREVDINGAKPHHGNNTSCNGNYQAGSSTGIIEIAVDEGEDDHEVEDFVLHVVGFQKLLCPPMHGTAGCLRNGVMQGATYRPRSSPPPLQVVRITQRCHSDVCIDQSSIIEGSGAFKGLDSH